MSEATHPSSKTDAAADDGQLWLFIRDTLSRGANIERDYRERPYEEFSAHLDRSALELLPKMQRLPCPGAEQLQKQIAGYRDALGRVHSQRDRMKTERDAAERKVLSAENERDRLRAVLEKASEALASAYQAAGILVMPEDDKRPSDKDQTELLDLLSRWETMTKEQIEAFLPWPKEWVRQPRDLAKAKQCAYDAFKEWNDVTGFVPRGISYEGEIESLLDDAVNFGWNARSAKPDSADETSAPLYQMSPAAADVIAERLRQLTKEGWSPEHDDQHSDGQLAEAAACYALSGAGNLRSTFERWWPWSFAWWKPKGERRDLVRAGALILAEIERLDRASKKAKCEHAQEIGSYCGECPSDIAE